MTNKRQLGAAYERKAAAFLESKGYEILEYNFRCKNGEIDLIARDGEYLVFVEVKYRENMRKGSPLEAISVQKQRTISKCAMQYMVQYGFHDFPVRFDVVGILKNEIQLVKNAFDYAW